MFTKPVLIYSIILGKHQIHNLKWVNSDNLRVSKHNLYRNWIPHTKGHFYKDYNYSRNVQVGQTGDLEPVVKRMKQHNYVKPAIWEYKTVRDWWTAILAKVRPHKSHVYSRPSYPRKATWSQCTKARILLYVEGVHYRSLADWLTAWAPEQWVWIPRGATPLKAHAIWFRSLRSSARPYRLGITSNQRADGSISDSLLYGILLPVTSEENYCLFCQSKGLA